MDYYQSVVAEWLVSDGRTLVAEEYYLRAKNVEEHPALRRGGTYVA